MAVRIESQRVLKAGNEHAPRPVIMLTLADAAGLMLPVEAARSLGTTLPPLRTDALDFPGW